MVRLAHPEIVGEKDHVELGALGRLRHFHIVLEIDASVGLRARMPPGRDMMTGRIEKGAESELTFALAHRDPPCGSARRRRVFGDHSHAGRIVV